jgi:hypothetical protein
VYEWALGTPFVDICQLTDVMEGSIVRAVVRLDQACRELQVRGEERDELLSGRVHAWLLGVCMYAGTPPAT